MPAPPSSSLGTVSSTASPSSSTSRVDQRPQRGQAGDDARPSCPATRGRTGGRRRISPPNGSVVQSSRVAGRRRCRCGRQMITRRRAPLPAGRPPPPAATVRGASMPGKSGSAASCGGVGVDPGHLQPGGGHPQGDLGLHRGLVAGDAGRAHERGQIVGDPVAVDGGDDGQLGRGQVLHPRRIGRVRQVGPPLPLTPTSPAGNTCTSQPACLHPLRVTGLPSAAIDDAGADGQHVAAERQVLLVGHLDQPDAARSADPRAARRGSSGRKTTARSSATGEITLIRCTSSPRPCQ